jgi:hypothetical protein
MNCLRAKLLLRVPMALTIAALGVHVALVVGGCVTTDPRVPRPLREASPAPCVDTQLELAERFAPFLFQATDPVRGREDLPSNVDFDGNLIGNDNWEHFPFYALTPTVYYGVRETGTHVFLSYHVFHPRDWAWVALGLQDTHENDGENLQVVVERATDEVVLLYTQAHYRGRAYANDRARFGDGAERVRGGFQQLGSHVCVFIESQGHGIYGTLDRCAEVTVRPDGSHAFAGGSGVLLRPAHTGERVREPDSFVTGEVPYRLESTRAKFGEPLPTLVGDGRLFDGPCRYCGRDAATHELPRYYDGNRYSGPLGNDRGISPFAVSFRFCRHEVGALYFDPAASWPRALAIQGRWSLAYLDAG